MGFKVLYGAIVCGQSSDELEQVLKYIEEVAQTSLPVLILGETGTGKDLLASVIHKRSGRTGPFKKLNAAEFDTADHLIPSGKWYGYGRDSGIHGIPREGQPGILEDTEMGTLFLDEIADLPSHVQTAILDVLENKKFHPAVGQGKEKHCNVRFIFATNQDLQEKIHQRLFREDLYNRMKRVVIQMPPLRERSRDIPALIVYFSEKYGQLRYSEDLFKAMLWHGWPDNIRGLKSFVETTQKILKTGHLNLKKLIELPIEDELKKALNTGYRSYCTASEEVKIGMKDEKLILQITEIAVTMFTNAWAALEKKSPQEWEKSIIEARTKLYKLYGQISLKNVLPHPLETTCYRYLFDIYHDKEVVLNLLRRIVQRLKKQKVDNKKLALSHEEESPRYSTFEKFFGVKYDKIRKMRRGTFFQLEK